MGVAELWDILKTASSPRVPLEVFVDQFILEHGRTPRVAIDAYMFIFQLDHSAIPLEEKAHIVVQNFMSKILALISLNVSIIVVFDGCCKPDKSKSGNGTLLYEDQFREFTVKVANNERNFSEEIPIVEEIKEILRLNSILYCQAPGEGEAQCAHFQRLGVVDFVISNDVDTLVFGATKMLRNYSRFLEDIGLSPLKKQATLKTRYYVTPIEMDKVEAVTGFSRSRLVFLASLRGGDYSSGVQRIGITNAKYLALCGTKYGLFYNQQSVQAKTTKHLVLRNTPRKNSTKVPPPDFATEFIACFVEVTEEVGPLWDSRLSEASRMKNLHEFSTRFASILNGSNSHIFGRNLTLKDTINLNEYYTLLYLFPFVDTQLPLFAPNMLSSGEFTSPLANDNGSLTAGEILQDTGLYVPESYNCLVKHIIFKLIKNLNLSIVKDRENEVQFIYNVSDVSRRFPNSIENRRLMFEGSLESKSGFLWVPVSLVKLFYPQLLQQYYQEKKDLEYYKKHKFSPQKTTLDMLENSPTKATKRHQTGVINLEPIPFQMVATESIEQKSFSERSSTSSNFKRSFSPSRRSSSPSRRNDSPTRRSNSPTRRNRSPARKKLDPNQKTLEFFLDKPKLEAESNPFFIDLTKD